MKFSHYYFESEISNNNWFPAYWVYVNVVIGAFSKGVSKYPTLPEKYRLNRNEPKIKDKNLFKG